MAVDIDDDTLQAVRNCWMLDNTLPTLVTEPPKAGRLKSGQSGTYAQIVCEFESRDSAGTGGAWHDYRKVTVKVWGTKANATAALAAINARFNLRLGTDDGEPFSYPSGARFIRWWPLDGGRLEEDPATKAGEDVWIGSCSGKVWSIRLE